MPSWDVLLSFVIASMLFAYMPGPALLYASAQTLARGRRAGLFAALGIHTGCYVHVIAAALGLSAIFIHVPTLYLVVKLAGAGYLIWLGISMLIQKADMKLVAQAATHSPGRAFLQSVSVEVLNPKTALFFIAFLPQFVDPAASLPVWAQLLTLGAIANLVFSSADIVCVLLAATVAGALNRSSRATLWTRRAGGSILMGLGLRLALTSD